jgi:L-asparagine transporter-like permease
MIKCILTVLLWIAFIVSGFMMVVNNLHNMHHENYTNTTETKFPYGWFALFLFCLTSLILLYSLDK